MEFCHCRDNRRAYAIPAATKARVRMGPFEIAVVQSDTTDIGTGTYTILTQVAAEALRLPTLRVLRRQGHHHHHPPEPVDERLVRAVKNGRSVARVVSVGERALR
jgi:CO/xanthine dehydrogenase Mo-binding subunit